VDVKRCDKITIKVKEKLLVVAVAFDTLKFAKRLAAAGVPLM